MDGRERGGVMIWRRRRCSSYAQPLGFCVLGGKYVRGPRERGGEGEGGREFRGMMGGSMSGKGK